MRDGRQLRAQRARSAATADAEHRLRMDPVLEDAFRDETSTEGRN